MSGLMNGFLLLFACNLLLAVHVSANKQQKNQNQGKIVDLGQQENNVTESSRLGEEIPNAKFFAARCSSQTKINRNRLPAMPAI